MDNPSDILRQVTASMTEATETVKGLAKDQKVLDSRMGELEQEFARAPGGGSIGRPAQASIGTLAMEQIQEGGQPAFENLKEWNAGTCRINIKAGIRAALTNDGAGEAGGTSVPRQPEQRGIFTSPGRPLRLLEALPSRPPPATLFSSYSLAALERRPNRSKRVMRRPRSTLRARRRPPISSLSQLIPLHRAKSWATILPCRLQLKC